MIQYVSEPFQGGSPAASWSAGGNFAINFDQVAGTITRMVITCRARVQSGGSAAPYQDHWDRLIGSMTLRRGSKTIFSFRGGGMRMAYHASRFFTPSVAPRRPPALPVSTAAKSVQFQYVFHFGVAPRVVNPHTGALEDNPFDLTAGIPPTLDDALVLSGNFGAANALGTDYTISDGDLWIDYDVVKGHESEVAPMAIPVWDTQSPALPGTSAAFGRNTVIEGGAYLRNVLLMATKGTNKPRSNDVLTSFDVFNPQTSVSQVI